MKYLFVLLMGVRVMSSELSSDSLVCEVSGEESKIVQCTYFCTRLPYERNITFEWNAPSILERNRVRTLLLPAHHGSIYDFRYYYGLEPGVWRVRIKEGERLLREVTFEIGAEGEEEY